MAKICIYFTLLCLALCNIILPSSSVSLRNNFADDNEIAISNEQSDSGDEDELDEHIKVGKGYSYIPYRGAHPPQKQKSNKKTGKENDPEFHESCHYPHRSTKPLYCFYSIFFGKRAQKDGADKKVLDKVFDKPETTQTPYVFEVTYPEPGSTNDQPINFILVEDSPDNRTKRIKNDKIVITDGGINKFNVTIRIETKDIEKLKYRIAVFTKNN